jgi:hypothetical protein
MSASREKTGTFKFGLNTQPGASNSAGPEKWV